MLNMLASKHITNTVFTIHDYYKQTDKNVEFANRYVYARIVTHCFV